MTLAQAQTVGLQYRGNGAADMARRKFERYMLSQGIPWKVERWSSTRIGEQGKMTRAVAIFACGCIAQIAALPVRGSLPFLCSRHDGKKGPQ